VVASFAQPPPEAVLDAMVRESLKVPARVWRAVFTDFPADDVSTELGAIAVPTLIVWGAQDATCPRSEQEALAATIAGAQLVVYPASGHSPHWEDPERFAADLVAFVEQVIGWRWAPPV
jgi:pimeloyl-ACP methyl ester carboxylesterase